MEFLCARVFHLIDLIGGGGGGMAWGSVFVCQMNWPGMFTALCGHCTAWALASGELR